MISKLDFEKKQVLFVFTNDGERISVSNQNIVVKDKDGKIKHQSTFYRIAMIFIIGNTTRTTPVLKKAREYKFVIFFMTATMKIYEVIGSITEGNTILHKKQYDYSSLEIGKHIIYNKMLNQKSTLEKIRTKTTARNRAIEFIDSRSKQVFDAKDIATIMGVEGSVAKVYFPALFDNVPWQRREPRIKRDFVNTTLDIGYSILFNFIECILCYYGFDLYVGVLHREFYMRKSLVCDMVEPFRAMIDYEIRKNINLNKFREEDFEKFQDKYKLKWKNNKKYAKAIIEPIMKNKISIFYYIQRYYREFMRGSSMENLPIFEMR